MYTIQELLDNIPPITIKDLKECGILTEMGYQGSSEQDDQTAITDQEVSVPPTKRSKYDYSHCLEDDDILRAEVIVPRRSCTSEGGISIYCLRYMHFSFSRTRFRLPF